MMKKRFSILTVVCCVIVSIVITFNTTYTIINAKHNKENAEFKSMDNFIGKLISVDEVIKENFAGEIDYENIKDYVVRGYLQGLGDSYSQYLSLSEYEEYMAQMSGTDVGIGIDVIYDQETNSAEIIDVIPNSPAENAGLKPLDKIIAVDAITAEIDGYYALIDAVSGEKGTEVSLTVIRDDVELTIKCVRDDVNVITVKHRVHSTNPDIGVIRISSFYMNTPNEVMTAVEALKEQGCTSFIFDLRYNGGGDLVSIVDTLDYLLPEGKLVEIKYAQGKTKSYTSDANYLDANVAVLVNSSTASAAELFAAALRDFTNEGKYNATLIGTQTYGKGVFQTFFKLSDGSAFKITCGIYNPPCGINYDGIGVEPNIIIDLSEEAKQINFYKLTDETDNQMAAAVNHLASKNK